MELCRRPRGSRGRPIFLTLALLLLCWLRGLCALRTVAGLAGPWVQVQEVEELCSAGLPELLQSDHLAWQFRGRPNHLERPSAEKTELSVVIEEVRSIKVGIKDHIEGLAKNFLARTPISSSRSPSL